MKLITPLSICIVCLAGALSCGKAIPREPMSFAFETDGDLNRLRWHCKTLFSLSDEHATQGVHSLRMELYPSDFPRFEPAFEIYDWSGYQSLCFDIYNPERATSTIFLRINDRNDSPPYYDCYVAQFDLKPGQNTINLPLATLFTRGTGRPLNLKSIYKFVIYMVKPARMHILYLDNLRIV
jgi:hypothetical protein